MWSTHYILPKDIEAIWPIVAPLLAPAVALSEGRYDMEAVRASLGERHSLLWVVYAEDKLIVAAFTTREARYPCATFLSVDFLGGEQMNDWVSAVDTVLSKYKTDAGLAGVEMVGRKGWTKALGAFGWRENAVMLVKTASVGAQEEAA